MRLRSFALAALLTAPLAAQRPQGPPAPSITPQGLPQSPPPPFMRSAPPSDAVMQQVWDEGMKRSQAMALLQELTDVVGPRLTGSPAATVASDWAVGKYKGWGIAARREEYGTWNAWRRGVSHLDLLSPRVRSLEALMLAWSPALSRPVDADVVTVPELADSNAATDWLKSVRGKAVLTTASQLSCRSPQQWQEFGTPESQARLAKEQDALVASWRARLATFGSAPAAIQQRLKDAGAVAVLANNWSRYPGIDKIFGSWRQLLPTFDVGCEDYALLARLAEKGQRPRVRLTAESEFLGEKPVFNTIAEIKGTEKPDEYVLLSAHFDSWDGSSGATDNGTGTTLMMEAMRILKAIGFQPKRTIRVGHWQGEEQGLNGSRAYSEDHPEVVQGLYALFNQDNGTGRITSMGPGALPGTTPRLEAWLREMPAEITKYLRMGPPGPPANGGSDNASFACYGAPAFGLGALGWDYGLTTWHTNRDTFDKLVAEDVMQNATFVAMLAAQAANDPNPMPRDRLDPLPNDSRTGMPQAWPACTKAMRKTIDSTR